MVHGPINTIFYVVVETSILHFFKHYLCCPAAFIEKYVVYTYKGMYRAPINTKSYFEQITPSRKAELSHFKMCVSDSCMYLVISIVSTSLYTQSYKYLFFRKLLIAFSTDAPDKKKKRLQFSVVSTIDRKDHALYRDTVAQQH